MQKRQLFSIALIYFYCSLASCSSDQNLQITENLHPDLIKQKTASFDSDLKSMVWCKKNSENHISLLALSIYGVLYQSLDHGRTWINENYQMAIEVTKYLKEKDAKIGLPIEIFQSNTNKNVVVITGEYGQIWITEDCGQTFRVRVLSRTIHRLKFHYKKQNSILFTTDDNTLYYSSDLFYSKIDQQAINVIQFAWGITNLENSDQIPDDRFLFTENMVVQPDKSIFKINKNTNLYCQDSFTDRKQLLLNNGFDFEINQHFIIVAQVVNVELTHLQIMVSDPNKQKLSFELAQFEEPDKQIHQFTILDYRKGQIVLNINHLNPDSPFGDVYIADFNHKGGFFLKQVLANNARNLKIGGFQNSRIQIDFQSVLGLEGVYMANAYNQQIADEVKNLFSHEEIDQDMVIDEIQMKNHENNFEISDIFKFKKHQVEELPDRKNTLITYDNGREWKPLIAPEVDSLGKPLQCFFQPNIYEEIKHKIDCNLILRSISPSNGGFYSSEQAHGIIIGIGRVLTYIYNSEINTYISRDAGKTWKEAMKGEYQYSVADHGSLILLYKTREFIDTIYYSINEGQNFTKLKISDNKINIVTITTEPSSIAQQFIIISSQTQYIKGNRPSIVDEALTISLDFEHLLGRGCQYPDQPDNPLSDYEYWIPSGFNSSKCLQGKTTFITRKKQFAICCNGIDFERQSKIAVCECTEDDWDCDFGYYRDQYGFCVKNNYQSESGVSSKKVKCLGQYSVPSGYRKARGNECERGVDYPYLQLNCELKNWVDKDLFLNVIKIILFIIVLALIYKYRNVLKNINAINDNIEIISQVQMQEREKNQQQGHYQFQSANQPQQIDSAQYFDDGLIEQEEDHMSQVKQKQNPIKSENLL